MELARGVRDFPPEVQLIREELFSKIRSAFERHGFAPLATPVIERAITLTFKFEGDEDVMDELFRFSDQGDRELALRYDLTVPLCRFVAMNKDLKFPFKRYEVGRVYRDGPIKLGRYREFWQCDADIVGSPSMLADAECIKVAGDVFATLPFEYAIKINNRKLLESILVAAGISEIHKSFIILDKLSKIGEKEVRKQLSQFAKTKSIDKVFDCITCEGTPNGVFKHIEERVGESEGLSELRELFTYLENIAHVEFDPTLARGLNYYTGTVYEVFLKDSKITSSVAAGGRYDNLIGQMRGSQIIPAVGVSFGIEPITDALLEEKSRFDKTFTQVYIIPIKTERLCAQIADSLRARGIKTDIDLMNRSISKNLDYANKLGIPFAIVLGEKDVQAGVLTLKNMATGEEAKIPLKDVDDLDLDQYA